MNASLTAERLREVLDYDPDTGVFWRKVHLDRWLDHHPRRQREPRVAGSLLPTGYRRVTVDGKAYRAHRLAWMHVHGEWPAEEIDHRNGKRDDNCIANLRLATHRQNLQNGHKPRRDGTSGFRGVSQQGGRWKAHIRLDGYLHHLGYFDSPEEASVAYLAAKRELHPFADVGI